MDCYRYSASVSHVVSKIPGQKSKAVVKGQSKYLTTASSETSRLAGLAIHRASGALVEDIDGNTFIDFSAGVCIYNVGHSHPDVIKAAQAQMSAVVGFHDFATTSSAKMLKKLASIVPNGLKVIQLYTGGSEAVEASFRLAKSYTKAREIIGFWGSFHGRTQGALAVSGLGHRKGFGPFPPGYYLVPYADCANCPIGLHYPECGIACSQLIRKQILNATESNLAGIIVEPIQGTNGNIIPPDDFLKELRKICDEFGGLLIVDEILTGLGRTGKMFAFEYSNIRPDIMLVGKALGSGFPIAALVSTKEIMESEPFSIPGGETTSFGGNAVSCAAALATLDVIDKENLVDKSRVLGDFALRRLTEIQERHPMVRNVRGRGLLLGFDLVNPSSNEYAYRRLKVCTLLYSGEGSSYSQQSLGYALIRR